MVLVVTLSAVERPRTRHDNHVIRFSPSFSPDRPCESLLLPRIRFQIRWRLPCGPTTPRRVQALPISTAGAPRRWWSPATRARGGPLGHAELCGGSLAESDSAEPCRPSFATVFRKNACRPRDEFDGLLRGKIPMGMSDARH